MFSPVYSTWFFTLQWHSDCASSFIKRRLVTRQYFRKENSSMQRDRASKLRQSLVALPTELCVLPLRQSDNIRLGELGKWWAHAYLHAPTYLGGNWMNSVLHLVLPITWINYALLSKLATCFGAHFMVTSFSNWNLTRNWQLMFPHFSFTLKHPAVNKPGRFLQTTIDLIHYPL